jgi:hypothetical protein
MLGFVKRTVPLGLGFFLIYKEPHQRTLERGHEGQDGFHHVARKWVTRVNSTNVLDEGLRIGGRGHRMNSTVEVSQTRRDYACIENKRATQLAQSQSVPGRPLLALYIGGQVSRIRLGSIQITISIYDIISYFDYDYDWA